MTVNCLVSSLKHTLYAGVLYKKKYNGLCRLIVQPEYRGSHLNGNEKSLENFVHFCNLRTALYGTESLIMICITSLHGERWIDSVSSLLLRQKLKRIINFANLRFELAFKRNLEQRES